MYKAGAVTSMQLGNGKWEGTVFNARLQPTEINLGTVQGGHDQLRLQYSYGDWVSGSIDATKNNGNIVQQVITVPTVGSNSGFTATQKYYYDALNRIDDATETISSTQTWRQDFSYDRYGNRNFVEGNTTFAGFDKLCSGNTELCSDLRKKLNPGVNTSNNRFSSGQDYSYDSSGNTTADANGLTFTYDAENKQVQASNSGGVVGQYFYDGDGKRIKKYVPSTGETTIFVYDAAGKSIAEYSTIVASTNDAKVAYLTNDHLGSPRINTDANGAVTARHDYHPFGEEITTSQRIPGLGYADDTVRKQFTGYERDDESGLDFAQARYFSSAFGRFSTPDDFLRDTKTVEPAGWNLYVYVRNNPLKFIDPSGESVDGSGLTDEQRTRLIQEFARLTGYRVEDLSFGANGILAIASGARSTGGSTTARRLLNEAINTSYEFVLVSVNTTDVAFAQHAPQLKPPIIRADGTRVSGGVNGQVRIDFADFNNAVFDDDNARQAFSLGLVVFHEFVHGLYPALDDNVGAVAGELEDTWINPIRRELGLATRDTYSASQSYFTDQQGQLTSGPRLSFTRYVDGLSQEPTFKNPFPEERAYPVTTHVYWQLNTVGGKVK